jgi:hypothetical protein
VIFRAENVPNSGQARRPAQCRSSPCHGVWTVVTRCWRGSDFQSLVGDDMSVEAGLQIKRLREKLGLSMRVVEAASFAIATKFGNPEFGCAISRISDIETKGVLPNIFRLFSLSAIYGKDFRELCALYGIDWDAIPAARRCVHIPKTHFFNAISRGAKVLMPVAIDPAFDVRRTTNVSRMIQKWGLVPAAFLSQFADPGQTYAFVGTEDFTMYPIVMPGSLLQVDERRTQIVNEAWRSEYERPIYFIETREEFLCAWCNLNERGQLMIQPHPLSPVTPRMFRYPQEAEVLGQVVGIAMRLDQWRCDEFTPAKKSTPAAALN